MSARWKLLVSVFALLSLTAIACSSDESAVIADILEEDDAQTADLPVDDGADDDGATEPVEEPEEEPGDEESADPDDEPVDLPDTDDDFCQAAADVDAALDGVMSGAVLPTPEQLEERLTEARSKMDRAIDTAPSDMRDAVETSAEGFDRLAAVFEAANYNVLDVDVTAMDAIDSSPEYEEANDLVTLYLFEKCGIGEDPATMVDAPDAVDELDAAEGTIRDQFVIILSTLGFTPEEADCVSRQPGFVDSLSASDEEVLALFAACGIPAERVEPLLSAF